VIRKEIIGWREKALGCADDVNVFARGPAHPEGTRCPTPRGYPARDARNPAQHFCALTNNCDHALFRCEGRPLETAVGDFARPEGVGGRKWLRRCMADEGCYVGSG